MIRKAKKYLFDINHSITNINQIHLSKVESIDDYKNNITVQRAVERELGIIDIASSKLEKLDSSIFLKKSLIQQVQGLAIPYTNSDITDIWAYIHADLPNLQTEVSALLNQPDD